MCRSLSKCYYNTFKIFVYLAIINRNNKRVEKNFKWEKMTKQTKMVVYQFHGQAFYFKWDGSASKTKIYLD